jgi:hypothetical protein
MRTLRRESDPKRLRRGIGVAAVALALAVSGVLVAEFRGAAALIDPVVRGDRGEPMTFEASAQRYDIIVAPSDPLLGFLDGEVASTRCTVTFADGRAIGELRGDRTGVSEETSFGVRVASFEAAPGPTTVVCDNRGGSRLFPRFLVASHRSGLLWASWGLIGSGVVLGFVAAWLITKGSRGHLVAVDPQAER